MNLPKLILASGSPRRSEILSFIGWKFEKQIADIDETEHINELPVDHVKRLAREKALFIAAKNNDSLVLGADTTVVIDNKIIGKPVDLENAREMINMLSGKWHDVLTGVALVKNSTYMVDVQKTRVKFKELNREEVEFLVKNGKPLDKAGAYAVQAQAALFIDKIEGDYWNVVGLPISLVYKMTKNFT